MMKNLRMHMMNIKRIINKGFLILILLTVFQTSFTQVPKTGLYDIGAICKNDSNEIITGYIKDGIGDEDFGSPIRTCFIYFTGKKTNNDLKIYLWEIKGRKILKYNAELINDVKIKNNFIIATESLPDDGICSVSTFMKKDSLFYTSMLFIKEKNWQYIFLTNKDDVPVFQYKKVSNIIYKFKIAEPVKVLLIDGKWMEIELDKGSIGWIEAKNVYDIFN